MPGRSDVQRQRPARRTLVLALLRALGSVAGLIAVYYLLPLDGQLRVTTGVALGIVLAAFVALAAVQVRSILRSPYPAIRATEVLAVLVPLFVLAFAGYYYVSEQQDPSSFAGSLTRTDTLYFTVTVLTTVGFGDIVPTSQAARIAVTVQMVADLVVLGVLIRTVLRAVSHSLDRQRAEGRHASPAAGDAPATAPPKDP